MIQTEDSPVNGKRSEGEDLRGEIAALRREVRALRKEIHEPAPDLLSVEEVAARVGISERTVRSFISDGTLPSAKVARRRLVPADAVDDFIRERVVEG